MRTREYSPPLDEGVRKYVEALNDDGIETFESCQGGAGHSYPEPTVRFHGGPAEGFRAFAVARERVMPVQALRRSWNVIDGELVGPYWEMTFLDAGATCLPHPT